MFLKSLLISHYIKSCNCPLSSIHATLTMRGGAITLAVVDPCRLLPGYGDISCGVDVEVEEEADGELTTIFPNAA